VAPQALQLRCTPHAKAFAWVWRPSALAARVNDTMAIENYISVQETDGPKFAAALEAQHAARTAWTS